MIPGSWQQVLIVVTLAAVLGGLWAIRPRRKGATRRREVLPAPSEACRRPSVESVP